tara:strand:- start:38 stop:160 length:123 start_codon:yes stop_codon:yes gene_type:complete
VGGFFTLDETFRLSPFRRGQLEDMKGRVAWVIRFKEKENG